MKGRTLLVARDLDLALVGVMRWTIWDAAHFSPPVARLASEKLIEPMLGGTDPVLELGRYRNLDSWLRRGS